MSLIEYINNIFANIDVFLFIILCVFWGSTLLFIIANSLEIRYNDVYDEFLSRSDIDMSEQEFYELTENLLTEYFKDVT
ncbi:MAG: hypothetical protein NC093_07195 [Alistipes sp.]|nr:hypothetical protein [Alistipes sp.]